MLSFDYARHNAEVRRIWAAFHRGQPERVPVVFNFSRRFWLLTPKLNSRGYTFRDYFEDPDVMMQVQLESNRWVRFSVLQDQEMGLPEKCWPGIHVDFQNSYEAGWFGCPIDYIEGDVPDTQPILQGDKRLLDELEQPDPLTGNLMKRAFEFYQYFEERRGTEDFFGLPIGPTTGPTGTDGPFTIACNLRGTMQLCLDLYEDPEYAHRLLSFVTDGIIARCKAWMNLTGQSYPRENWGFADDSVQLLSEQTYREFVLPYHRRLIQEFAQGPVSIHLCGQVAHLLPILKDDLNIMGFDTGFPVDLGELRRMLGPEVLLRGNVHPEVLRQGPPAKIEDAVRRVLTSGAMLGGRLILCEGNNVAPGTPVENFAIMYQTAQKYGRYS